MITLMINKTKPKKYTAASPLIIGTSLRNSGFVSISYSA